MIRPGTATVLLAALLAAGSALAAPQVALLDGQPRTFRIGASGYTTEFFFDLPAGVRQFRVELDGINAGGADLDLLLRQGKPFPESTGTFQALLEYAHYPSISAETREYVVVGPQSHRPASAGRWYLALYNGAGNPVDARISLQFQVPSLKPAQFEVRFDLPCPTGVADCECDPAAWTDATPGPPAPGNPGTTLGAKRRNAFLEAMRLISTSLTSEAPIQVQACWGDLGSDVEDEGVTLAGALPLDVLIDDPTLIYRTRNGNPLLSEGQPLLRPGKFLPEPHAFYAAAAAARLAGTDYCRAAGGECAATPVLFIQFNDQVDTPTALGNAGFYYGLQPPLNSNPDADFITVAMHEVSHGLGFGSNLDISAPGVGAKLLGRDDIYDRQISDARAAPALRPFTALDDAGRAAVLRSVVNLQWTNPETLARATILPLSGEPGFRLYAPSIIEPGSTLSHVDPGFLQELMEPSLSGVIRRLGVAEQMLYPLGWSPAERVPATAAPVYTGLWYDPQRPGHGVDFQPVDGPGPYDQAVALFYSYDASGQPEYYIAQGPMVDGVFVPTADANGASLVRYVIRNGVPVADTGSRGYLRMDFNDAGRTAACQRPGAAAGPALRRAAMVVVLDGVVTDWCLEPLIEQASREVPDRTGIWINGASNDPGWGLTLAPFKAAGSSTTSLFGIVYYHDGAGQPRWAFAQADSYAPGQALGLTSISGYCRACGDNGRPGTAAGTLTLDLRAPQHGNRAALSVGFPGTPAVRFERADTPITRLTAQPRLLDGN